MYKPISHISEGKTTILVAKRFVGVRDRGYINYIWNILAYLLQRENITFDNIGAVDDNEICIYICIRYWGE